MKSKIKKEESNETLTQTQPKDIPPLQGDITETEQLGESNSNIVNEQNKINKRVFILLLAFLLIIAVFAAFAYFTSKPYNMYYYNGFAVSKVRYKVAPSVTFHSLEFKTQDKTYNVPLRNDPRALEDIEVGDLTTKWVKKTTNPNYNIFADKIFLTFDPSLSGGDLIVAGGEIVRILGREAYGVYKIPTGGAFTALTDSGTIIKKCDDATKSEGIIELRLGNKTAVYRENDCIIVEGTTYNNLIRAADRFILALLGVV